MTAADLKAIADLLKDDRTPCHRDGHDYQVLAGGNEEVVFCSKCGETKGLPKPKQFGLASRNAQ